MKPEVLKRRFLEHGTAGISSGDIATLIELFEAFCRWRYVTTDGAEFEAEQDMLALGNKLEGLP